MGRSERGKKQGSGQRPRQPTAGDTIAGRYELRVKVGEGGMGEVWEARDALGLLPGQEGRVAIKLLTPESAAEPASIERFRREAKLLTSLAHPNIVKVFDSGADGDRYFLVMEFLDGRPGNRLIADCAPVRPTMAAEIVAQLCYALHHAHEGGVVHRDIKPHNVMVVGGPGERGPTIVKLMDFGIARALNDTTITRHAHVVGTLAYLAPERVRGGRGTSASDIYSAGVLLYQLLIARLPYAAAAELDELAAQQRWLPRSPHSIDPEIPRQLSEATLCALEAKPSARFADAEKMGSAAIAGARGEDISEYTPTSATRLLRSVGTVLERARSRRRPNDGDDSGAEIDWSLYAKAILVGGLGLVVIAAVTRLLALMPDLSAPGLASLILLLIALLSTAVTQAGRRYVTKAAGNLWLAIRPLGADDPETDARAEAARAGLLAASRRFARLLLVAGPGAYWLLLTYHLSGEMQDVIRHRPASEHLAFEIGVAVLWLVGGLVPLGAILISRRRVMRLVVSALVLMCAWTVGAEMLPKAPGPLARLIWPDHRVALRHRVSAEEKRWGNGTLRGRKAWLARGKSPAAMSRIVRRAAGDRIHALRTSRGADNRFRAKERAGKWLGRMRHARHKWDSPRCRHSPTRVRVVVANWGARVTCG